MSTQLQEPLPAHEVRQLVQAICATGSVHFSKHACEEMAKDALSELDVRNVLRGGTAREGELENGSWRYRVDTSRIVVVIAFRSPTRLVVVTAWRL